MTNNILRLNDDTDWRELCERLTVQNERMTAQAGALIQQNGYLRKANNVQPHIKLVEKAIASAKLLALWHVAGYLTGRDSAFSFGMSNSYFFAGRALLILANVHDGESWLTDNADRIQDRLTMAADLARNRPELLAANIPNSKRPLAYRKAANGLPFGKKRST